MVMSEWKQGLSHDVRQTKARALGATHAAAFKKSKPRRANLPAHTIMDIRPLEPGAPIFRAGPVAIAKQPCARASPT